MHATSFVIASRDARTMLDQTCVLGRNWWGDEWWSAAVDSGFMHIANHSWDHCHDSLSHIAQRDQLKGTFCGVDTLADADAQIKAAAERSLRRSRRSRVCACLHSPMDRRIDTCSKSIFLSSMTAGAGVCTRHFPPSPLPSRATLTDGGYRDTFAGTIGNQAAS